jgi:hydrogenase maturation protein HypF
MIVELAGMQDPAPRPVALSGGVFQNTLLLRLTLERLHAKGFEAITHRHVPPNDGGLALGQLLVGNAG